MLLPLVPQAMWSKLLPTSKASKLVSEVCLSFAHPALLPSTWIRRESIQPHHPHDNRNDLPTTFAALADAHPFRAFLLFFFSNIFLFLYHASRGLTQTDRGAPTGVPFLGCQADRQPAVPERDEKA